jgi:hypothetical protein
VDTYWAAVRPGGLKVARDSLELAGATYERDKRALELGALPPLEIHRSESTVATRRLQVIEAEYALKRSEDRLRRLVGADQDAAAASLALNLTEEPRPSGELMSVVLGHALERAQTGRPELVALRHELENADLSLRVARSGRRPDVSLGLVLDVGPRGQRAGPTRPRCSRATTSASPGRHGARLRYLRLQHLGEPAVPEPRRRAVFGRTMVGRRRVLYRLREQEQAVASRCGPWTTWKAKASYSVATWRGTWPRRRWRPSSGSGSWGEHASWSGNGGPGQCRAEPAGRGQYRRAAVARATGTLLGRVAEPRT